MADVIKLYDNLLVGRKRSAPHKRKDVKVMDKSVDDDYLEDNDEYEGLAALLNLIPTLSFMGLRVRVKPML